VYDGEKSDSIAETMKRHRWRRRFDRKAEIEECAAPSAVNFRVLSSRGMLGGGGFTSARGVPDHSGVPVEHFAKDLTPRFDISCD